MIRDQAFYHLRLIILQETKRFTYEARQFTIKGETFYDNRLTIAQRGTENCVNENHTFQDKKLDILDMGPNILPQETKSLTT